VRAGLLLLAIAATTPFIILTGWRARDRADTARAAAESRAVDAARTVADRLDQRAQIIGTLLSATAPQVRTDTLRARRAAAANDSILLAVKQSLPDPIVTNLWVQALSGANLGTSRRPVPVREAINAADRPYFQAAIATHRPAIGDPVRARPDSTVWSVTFAHPVLDPTGHVRVVVLGTVHLGTLQETLAVPGLPPGAVVVLADAHGHVVARAPGDRTWLDRLVSERLHPPAALDSADGVIIDAGRGPLAGRRHTARLVAAVRARRLPWRVYVTLPAAAAFAPVERELARDAALGALTLAVALLLALGAARTITRPLAGLTADATALASGDYTRHTPHAALPAELGQLAATFDEMAAVITARTAELHKSEQRYRFLFEASPLPTYLADVATYVILAANDAACAQYGYTREEFTRRTLLDLRPERERLRFMAEASAIPSAVAGDRRGVRLWRHLRRDGSEFDVEVYTSVTEYAGRPARLSIALDVTARREAERALAESQEQLRRGQKMEALGRFAGGIAHDFNNLLTGILGACELALADLPTVSSVRDDVVVIRDAARRAAALTGQILSFSRGHVTQATLLSPAAVVAGLEPMLARVIGEDVRLETPSARAAGRILADGGQLEQVVMNLVLNARDAMPSGGTVSVSVTDVDVHAPDPDHPGVATGPWVRLAVSDTGSGMDDATQARIFEPFFTTKARGKGTGFGLATVYGIVTGAGGLVRVTSAPDAGSTFALYWPRVAAPAGATPAHGTYVGAPARTVDDGDAPVTVLLVEDERAVRTVAREVLARSGYHVLVAEDGMQALAVARAHRGPIDLLVTDVVMPGMSGRELAEALAQERPATRVLFTSGYTEDEVLHRGVSADTVAFLPKPFTPAALVERVAAVLAPQPAGV
jgi:PAS domain S-box-containing protein